MHFIRRLKSSQYDTTSIYIITKTDIVITCNDFNLFHYKTEIVTIWHNLFIL